MKHLFLTTTLIAGVSGLVFGQDPGTAFTKSDVRTVKSLGLVNLQANGPEYDPSITTIGIFHDPDESSELPAGVKIRYPVMVNDGAAERGERTAEAPAVVGSWNGYNDASYTPPDNSIAVSNDGIVVSAMNSNYRVFDRSGKQLLAATSFATAFSTKFPGLPNKYFDPRVVYDSDKDRFIIVILNGSTHDVSKIMIMFSKTKNPLDGWYLYAVSGDVLNNELWTDYPSIALSKDELFITGNLFDDWQAYDQSFIIQMKKDGGFAGDNLEYQVWNNLNTSQGEKAFSIVPMGYGLGGNYGSGMYFVTNGRLTSDIITLFYISDHMDASNEQLVRYTISSPFTIASPNLSQQKNSSDYLNTGDARAKSGFYLNGIIHYVLTTRNSAGNSSIAYFRINVSTKKADYRLLGQADVNYAYPSIISLAKSTDDQSVLIGFLRSGTNLFPEIRVAHCNSSFEFSESTSIKDGTTAVNELPSGEAERWGDYTGFARKYNSVTGMFAGCYGYGGRWKTQIAEIGLSSEVASVQDEVTLEPADMNVFPNPARDFFKMTFKLKEKMQIDVSVYDIMGRKIETLYKGTEMPGEKQFSFNRAALTKGTYLLRVTGEKGEIATKKVVVE
jgi:hypothetical protein